MGVTARKSERVLLIYGAIGLVYGLLIIVGLPYVLFAIRRLTTRMKALEAEVERLRWTEREPARSTQEDSGEAPSVPDTLTASAPETAPEPEVPNPAADVAPAPAMAPAAPYVLRADNVAALSGWLRANWTLAVAALSLIFGGLFMVQYGVEHGLLTPPMRVLGALVLGAAMVAAGEWLRRRGGDVSTAATRHLPSTFAGSGIVVLFIAVLSADVLYGLIGADTALAGIAAIAAGAVLAGWIYGAFLPAVGLLGAAAAPFLVSATGADTSPFYAYYAILGLAGLAIDSFRHWAWVSALALVLASGGLILVHLDADLAPALIAAAFTLALGALILPERRLVPDYEGPALHRPGDGQPSFPAMVGAAGILIATAASMLVATDRMATGAEFGLAVGAMTAVFVAIALWLHRAPQLDLTVALPATGFLAVIAQQAVDKTAVFRAFQTYPQAQPETPLPQIAWWLVAAAALMAVAATSRLNHVARRIDDETTALALPWAIAAGAMLPATALLLEFLWSPATILGPYPWALAVMTAAALQVLLTQRRAARGGVARQRDVGLLAASAFLLIALALFVLLTESALTLGLALLMVLAALLDRRFDLPVLSWTAQLGAAVIGYRLLIDPGLDFAIDRAGWPAFLTSHLGALAGFEATRRLARADRPALAAVAESALVTTLALTAMLTLARIVGTHDARFWLPGLMAAPWAASAEAQVWRVNASRGAIRVIRIVFALISTAAAIMLAVLATGMTVLVANGILGQRVAGPPVFDTLALAFLPLSMTLAAGAWALGLPGRPGARVLRPGLAAAAAIFAALWAFFEIRRLWRGPDFALPGPSDGELYSYTLAMLLVSLAVLAAAVVRRSETLRRIAMAGVALTIVKVFLLDMSGLSGLTRVASFVGLGLALAALAWINRRIDALWRGPGDLPPAADA